MLQTHEFPDDDLNRQGKDDDGFDWETDRGIGPRPCSLDPAKCYWNNRYDRVRMWDIDSTWSLNINSNNYKGAPETSDYVANVKKVLEVDGIKPEFLHYNASWTPPSAEELTMHGGSDGTSRTNVHAASCYLSTPIALANADGDTGSKFSPYWDSNTNYYAARPAFWPYTWGTLRAINADVDWTAPTGCDLSYGPPCNYEDAVSGKFHDPNKAKLDYNGIYHQQGGPGVFGCTAYSGKNYRDRFNQLRGSSGDWDHNTHPTGAHSCTNLMNVTHFSLGDLELEEWDMRAPMRHDYGQRNCNYDDGVAIRCNIAGVSLNCHNAINPIDNSHHTYVYNSTDGLKAKFFVGDHRADAKAADGEKTAPKSPNNYAENDGAVWVNWGKRLSTSMQNGGSSGDTLSRDHTVYANGKDDGVVECLRPRDDLLLHSLLKRTWSCEGKGIRDKLKLASPCANPKEYHEWRQGLAAGDENDFFFMDNNERKASGRHYSNGVDDGHSCVCLGEGSCNCNLLARTTRLVVGNEAVAPYFDGDKPYSPQWVRDPAASTPWCDRGNSAGDDPGFVPNRACPKDVLLRTPLWDGTSFVESDIPDALVRENAKAPFVRRKNSVFTRGELEQMRACVNVEGNDFCQGDVAELGGTPSIVLTKANAAITNRFVPVVGTADGRSCGADFFFKNQINRILDGLQFTPVAFTEDNRVATGVADVAGENYCLVEPDPNTAVTSRPYLDWNIDYDPETFTFTKESVANAMGIYELRKLQQCLSGSGTCPTITYKKRMVFTFPTSSCPVTATPRIMYRCFEDNDPEGVMLEDSEFLTPLASADNSLIAAGYNVRGFEHKITGRCIDKIQFALECDGNQELHELDNDVCKSYSSIGFNLNCRPTVNRNVLKAAMCVKPLEHGPNGMPQFNLTAPAGRKLSEQLGSVDTVDCSCKASPEKYGRIIARDGNGLCHEQLVDDRLVQLFADADTPTTPANFDVSVCTPTYREVDLSDYRRALPMHVYWRHCSALQIHFKGGIEEQYPDAHISVSSEINSAPLAKFYARLAIQLPMENREAFDSGSIMWAYESADGATMLRELVPGACRGLSPVRTQSGTSSAMFTRQVSFDFAPGEPLSEIEGGVCATGEDICTDRTEPVFFKNLLPHGFGLGLSAFSTRMVDANECAIQCQVTEDCKTFAHTGDRCLLFKSVPRLARQLVEDFGEEKQYSLQGVFLNKKPAIGDQVGFGTCFDPTPISFSQVRPPPPPPPRCPSGQALVPVDLSSDGTNRQYTCVKSVCDRDREVALPLNVPVECNSECQQVCGGTHEELNRYTAHTPTLWTADGNDGTIIDVDTSNNIDYNYADSLPIGQGMVPRFEFLLPKSGETFLSELPRRIAQLKFTLPPVKLRNCNPCLDPTTGVAVADCHNHVNSLGENNSTATVPTTADVRYDLYGDDGETPLFSGTKAGHSVIEGKGPGHQTVQEIGVTLQPPIDVELYSLVRLVVTVDNVQGSMASQSLEYNLRGARCSCTEHNPNRRGLNLSELAIQGDTAGACANYSEFLPADPGISALPSATVLLCDKAAEPPEVCVLRTECNGISEYELDPGSLERDRVCARQPVCLSSEYEQSVATPSTLRECAKLVECSPYENTTRVADRRNQFECSALGRCTGADTYRNTVTKVCATRTVCSADGLRQIKAVSDYADAECTAYEVICNAVQYETAEQSATTETECASYTICEEQQFSLSEATVSTDRTCKALQTCRPREVYRGPDDFVTDAVCSPIVRFSVAWVSAAAIALGYLGCAFVFVYEDKKFG